MGVCGNPTYLYGSSMGYFTCALNFFPRQSMKLSYHHHQCTVYRLIRGDGEIVEEIVSKQRQQQINKVHQTYRSI